MPPTTDYSPDAPPQISFSYYKGATFRFAHAFTDRIDNGKERAQLAKPDGQTFAMQIRYDPLDSIVLATIDSSFFVLGSSAEDEIYDELSIEAPGHLFTDITPGEWYADIFTHYEINGTPYSDALLRIRLMFIENVTKQDSP